MGINEVSEILYYCSTKCQLSTCGSCKSYDSCSCEAQFFFDLYDVIDTKTLEQNNIFNIIKVTDEKLDASYLYDALDSFAYNILELFLNNRYILTKKDNCDKLLEESKKLRETLEDLN